MNGTQIIPTIAFGAATGDPIITGSTNMFTAANFPGANATDMQTNAPALYALLTGRVSAINRSVVLDEETKQYGPYQPIVRNHQREVGLYFQDSWRLHPRLTFNYGVRWDRQNPPVNDNGVYTRPGYAGVWGVSGVGNLFKPGTLTGQVPVFNATAPGEAGFAVRNKQFSPSVGLAWQVPNGSGPLGWIFGKGTVIRAGYAINTIREDGSTLSIWGGNQGRTLTLNVDPTNFPAQFGAPGSVLFRNPVLPSRVAPTTPSFPLAVAAGTNSVTDFDPNLKTGYVQSWDIGIQRELTRDTVLEVRYVGNHGTDLWRQVNINEINIFENGFVNEFKTAQNNLALARGCASPDPVCMSANRARSNQYFGLPGQQPLPLIFTALAANNDATSALQIEQGQAGALANAIATNAARMTRLTAAGSPINLFQVNPDPDHGRRQPRSQRRQHQLSRPAGGIEAPHVQGPAVPGQLRVEPFHLQRAEPGHRRQLHLAARRGLRQVGLAVRHSPGGEDELGVRTAVRPQASFLRPTSRASDHAQGAGRLATGVGDAPAVRVADPPDQRTEHLQPERLRRDPAQHDDEPVAGHDDDPQDQRWRPPPPAPPSAWCNTCRSR